MQVFLSAFKDVPDPRASNTRHDLEELLVIAFVSVICRASSCSEMAAFAKAKEHISEASPLSQDSCRLVFSSKLNPMRRAEERTICGILD